MKQVVFYLKQHSLIIQTEKQVLKRIALSSFVKDSTIEDHEAFILYLKDQIKPLAKKIDSSIIILGSGLLFQKAVESNGKLDQSRKELLDLIPFSKEFVQEKIIKTPSKTYLLVTDKSFYGDLVNVLSKEEIDTIAVLPLSLFSDESEDELTKDEIKSILGKEKLYETGNFLEDSEVKEESIEKMEEVDNIEDEKDEDNFSKEDTSLPYETVSSWNSSRLLLILGFLVVLTFFLGGLIYLQQTHNGLLSITKPTPTPIQAPSSTPTPVLVAKPDLSVEVQNGTGTPGQAATVKGLMEGLEYTDIETGNADNTDHEQTEVTFSGKVDANKQQEIKDILLKSFSAVTTSVDKSQVKDIVVITGTEK